MILSLSFSFLFFSFLHIFLSLSLSLVYRVISELFIFPHLMFFFILLLLLSAPGLCLVLVECGRLLCALVKILEREKRRRFCIVSFVLVVCRIISCFLVWSFSCYLICFLFFAKILPLGCSCRTIVFMALRLSGDENKRN
jgi:hypothetical protein